MTRFAAATMLYLVLALPLQANEWVEYRGHDGPGAGKHIVLVSGDEEYRSEEGLPMLGKILAVRHGFRCTVLFSINPDDGTIDPTNQTNIPGFKHIADADLVVMLLRFRELPDDEMKHFVDYLNAGKPILALRTSTHAFDYSRTIVPMPGTAGAVKSGRAASASTCWAKRGSATMAIMARKVPAVSSMACMRTTRCCAASKTSGDRPTCTA
jgi:hypothetical protein